LQTLLTVRVGVAVRVDELTGGAVAVLVAVEILVAVAVGTGVGRLQPKRAALSAVITSSTVTRPFRSPSATEQRESGIPPSPMVIPVMISSICTAPSSLQSPKHAPGVGGGGAVGVGVAGRVLVGGKVLVDVGVSVAGGVDEAVGVAVGVPLEVAVDVGPGVGATPRIDAVSCTVPNPCSQKADAYQGPGAGLANEQYP
jgi:hypothetical protein